MKIILCGSITAAHEILQARQTLEAMGHQVEIPEGVKNPELLSRTDVSESEKASDKIKYDLIRGYYEKIKQYDAVLIINPDKKGIKHYIGGNSFIEMAFARALNKKLYCLYPLPEMGYSPELIAMQPSILNGNLAKLL